MKHNLDQMILQESFVFWKSDIFLNGVTLLPLTFFPRNSRMTLSFCKRQIFFLFRKNYDWLKFSFFFSSKHKRVLSHCFSIKVVILKYKPCKGPKAYKTWPWCMCNSWWMKLRERKRRRKRNSWSLVLVWAKNYYKRFAIWTIDGVFSIC